MFTEVSLFMRSIFMVGCTNNKEPKQPDCSRVACTLNFVSLSVKVQDASGVAIPLDSYTVIDIDTGEKLTLIDSDQEFENNRETGFYAIFNDSYRLQYQNVTTTLSFSGHRSGEAIVNETFVVGADCCHVQLISGNLNIVLD